MSYNYLKKGCFAAGLLFFNLSVAQQSPLGGYAYGDVQAPTGKEWESEQQLALNKEQPKAYFFTFADKASARRVLPENSTYWQSLDGQWKFHWVKKPDERPKEFFKPSFDVLLGIIFLYLQIGIFTASKKMEHSNMVFQFT